MVRANEGDMTEYRLVGSAIVNQRRQQIACNHEFDDPRPDRSRIERFFRDYCANRDYLDPDLIDWYPV